MPRHGVVELTGAFYTPKPYIGTRPPKMANKFTKLGLTYLNRKPKVIRWKVVAGPPLTPIQSYDVVFDAYDLKIRGFA
jgi:hypothetical protein